MVGNQEKTAMRRRKWGGRMKAMIIPQGLKSDPVGEICLEP
jgi:hypothetical protein